MAIQLTVNGSPWPFGRRSTCTLAALGDPVIISGLTGTKFSCGISQCGACTLHIDAGVYVSQRPRRSRTA